MDYDQLVHLSFSVLENISCNFVLKNSFTLIEKLENFEVLDSDFLVTADVTSLYTLVSLSRLFSCLREKGLPDFETDLIRFICKNNYFIYGSAVFKQSLWDLMPQSIVQTFI